MATRFSEDQKDLLPHNIPDIARAKTCLELVDSTISDIRSLQEYQEAAEGLNGLYRGLVGGDRDEQKVHAYKQKKRRLKCLQRPIHIIQAPVVSKRITRKHACC
jgi:hypothetical protein